MMTGEWEEDKTGCSGPEPEMVYYRMGLNAVSHRLRCDRIERRQNIPSDRTTLAELGNHLTEILEGRTKMNYYDLHLFHVMILAEESDKDKKYGCLEGMAKTLAEAKNPNNFGRKEAARMKELFHEISGIVNEVRAYDNEISVSKVYKRVCCGGKVGTG